MQLYKEPVRTTKLNRLCCCFGHVQRMGESRFPKKILKTKPENKRSAGRPKARWFDAAFLNLRTVGVIILELIAQNKTGWKGILEKVKTLNGL